MIDMDSESHLGVASWVQRVVTIIVVWLPSKTWHVGALVLVWLCTALRDLASSTLL